MDLQSLLLCPMSNVSSIYYKRKLGVHNLTFYNLQNKEVKCYVWNESEGGLNANEFTSIIVHFVDEQLAKLDNDRKIVLYSDGCYYQNRNATLSNALLNVAKLRNITIEQKYLEKGHTHMEADSVHSQIERQVRNRIFNVPADYCLAMKNARRNPFPYVVQYLEHSFFLNYEGTLKAIKSIRPGKKVGDPCVTDLRAIKYTNNALQYKLRFHDEWKDLPTRVKVDSIPVKTPNDIPSLYSERLKISKAKFDDLQDLKNSIPVDYHSFYDQLPWK